MKTFKKGIKKGKFVDLNEYDGKKSTVQNDRNNKDIVDIKNGIIKSCEEYETPLQTLFKLFPNYSEDIVESIYEDSDRTFIKAKKSLEFMSYENSKDECLNDKNSLNKSFEKENYVDVKSYGDINSLVNFKYEGDYPFIDECISSNKKSEITKTEDIRKKKYYIDVSTILAQQKKNSNDYISAFETASNELTPKNKSEIYYAENYLEELTLDYYCDILIEFFPKLTRLQIMQKICEYDFDIDKLVLYLFDEKDKNILTDDFDELASSEISKYVKEEVLSNFYSVENHNLENIEHAIFNHNLQNKIEKEIIKNNINSKLYNVYNENEFPFLSDEVKSHVINSNHAPDEYFLDKEIKDIKSKHIKEDLMKLCKNFPLTDEFEIKWVYYQYMSYLETFKHFKNNGKKSALFDNNFSDTKKKPLLERKYENKFTVESTDIPKDKLLICKIISEKPSEWKIESNLKNINISDYQSIRKKLIQHAQLAWKGGRHEDAKIIMAKARRYKQEINTLLKNKKIEIFVKNNEINSIVNMINNNENFLDIHGLSFEESKMLIEKKISDIRKQKQNGIFDDSKKFKLNIITGVGNHSKDRKPVLLPKISALLKKSNYFIKIDQERGVIRLYF